MRVTTLGDLLLDVIVGLDQPLVLGDDQMAVTRTGPGGQAANVAAWAAVLGGTARFVGRRGDDPASEIVTRALTGYGVEVVGPVGGRTGVVVSIASAGDRTMASDRGVSPELEPRDLDAAWFDCDVLHLSGYSLLREPIASASVDAAALAREHGAQVAVDISTWTLVDDAFRARVRAIAPDVVFATEAEQDAVGALDTRWVLKRGARGLEVDGKSYPSAATDVVDTTGAGDALAAGYLIGGAELGLEAAARCCAQLGAMPLGAMPHGTMPLGTVP
ncbi:MAG TPA: carbohydrate kinase family protein [Gaiellaceae bacterium]|nr:carbohydrate kinase family protein [Gaiellaceae bacterium]